MSSLDVARAELALAVLYLNKAEARDKICRAIQYGSKFLSNGEPGTAQNVDKTTSLARKVFRLFKFINDLHALVNPVPEGTPIPLIFLGKSKNALVSSFLFFDQFVWLHRTGIYQNKENAEILGRISLFCWLGSTICTSLVEVCVFCSHIANKINLMFLIFNPLLSFFTSQSQFAELGRLSASMKRLKKDVKDGNEFKNEQYRVKLQKSRERSVALIKASLDTVVAIGLLQLAPDTVTARVTGAFGFVSSLISCYQVLLKTI
ncbi:hypothetical protein QQ045_026625 [Rhodiola kirilowii]